ncbi:hypothetical protein ACVWWR_000446 [Bradyrhizobium sp. LM3.2]
MDVVAIMIVVALMAVVSSHGLGIRFAENCSDQRFVNVGCRVQCVLDDIYSGAAPFNN